MNTPSFLPYVMPDIKGIHLKLTFDQDTDMHSGDASGIFKIMDDPDGLTRLYEASMMTDAGSPVSRLFLLVQRNRYGVGMDETSRFSNMDIELCWQRAFRYYTQECREMPVHLFTGQKGKGDILLPFQSLFYCRGKNTYFHPPCPQCGGPLNQCHDDELLISAGLPAYSSSMERFLFCPTCHESDQSTPFYMADRDGRYDPAAVKDQNDLIRAFGNIRDAHDVPGALPCVSCDRRDQCYGPECLVVINIIPFSFYPFYLLAFDAGSMNAVDFIALLSETSAEDLSSNLESETRKGRMLCVERLKQQPCKPAFFYKEGDERRFLEILYLKLTFLQEMFTHFFLHLNNPRYPNPEMILDRLWVKFNPRVGLLPFFWNFTVLPFCGIIGHGKKGLRDKQLLPFNRLYDMGLAWLRVLISNQQNDIRMMSQAIMQSFEIENITDKNIWITSLMDAYPSIFAPEQISRKADVLNINDHSQALFNIAVRLGLSLIRTGLGYDPDWSEITFDLDLKTLRETITETLFPHTHSHTATQDKLDGNAGTIVAEVKRKIFPKEDVGLLSDTDDHEIVMKTVILNQPTPSSEDFMEEKRIGGTPLQSDENDDLNRTVIIPAPPSKETKAVPPQQDDDLEKNRVISENEPEKTIRKNFWGDSIDDSDDDFLKKTLRMGKRKKTENKKDQGRT